MSAKAISIAMSGGLFGTGSQHLPANRGEVLQKAKARYAPELAAREIDFSKGLGPALDKWAVSYKAFNKTVNAVAKKKALWTSIQPLARAKIKTEAKTLQTDAAAVAKVAGKYLTAIDALDKDDPAKADLTTILTKISDRANSHERRAAKAAGARAN